MTTSQRINLQTFSVTTMHTMFGMETIFVTLLTPTVTTEITKRTNSVLDKLTPPCYITNTFKQTTET